MSALAMTFHDLFADNLPEGAERVMLVQDGRTTTYGEMADLVDRIAGYLRARGVGPGDRVVVQLRKSAAEVAAMLAVARVGGVFVNVNAQWTPDQLRYVAQDSGARLLIVEPGVARAIDPAAMPGVERVLVNGAAPAAPGFDGWEAVERAGAGAAIPRLDTELAAIIYTSGSTGAPKGVMLSHRNIVTGARSVARYLGLGPDERLLGVLPYSFDYGLNQLTTAMLTGGTVVHLSVPMAAEAVRVMRDERVTGVAAVPPLWHQIVRVLDARPVAFPTLRRITNSGGRISTDALRRFPDLFPGADVFLMYGLTEAFRSTFLRPDRFEAKMGSIGQAIPGAEVYVVKAGQGVAGPGEQGELVHRGPLVSMGYWGKPEATAEKIRPCPELAPLIGDEPVVYSGDIVRVDEDGDLWFVGRNDAMIKTSGFRVSPDEVEDLVYRSGMVADAVAFGVPDEMLGEVVHVAATPLDGYDADAFLAHCRRAMPSYMVPRRVHLWPAAMPRTASGKLDRPEVVRACRDMLAAPSMPTPIAV